MTAVIVAGPLANKAGNGGIAWNVLSYVLGLRRLGVQVHFLEELRPEACVDERGRPCPLEESEGLRYFREVTAQFGLGPCLTLFQRQGGALPGEVADLLAGADLLINLSGHLALGETGPRPRRCVYIDEDPGYTQCWHAAGALGSRLEGHEAYYTVGENVGSPDCGIPSAGIAWQPTRQPVVLDWWPVSPQGNARRFTTVASWRGGYGRLEYGGKTFGLKVHEFRKFLDLPRLAGSEFEVALDIHPADRGDLERLLACGWRIADPARVAHTPLDFRCYLQESGAEFSVAQGVYVETNSGWFSDRTARYLASGKPALVQETGFRRNLPTGLGLIPFSTMDEAVAGADEILEDYARHATAARALAEEYFDSDVVLGRLLGREAP